MAISLETVKGAFTFATEQCPLQLEAIDKVISQKIAVRDCMLEAISQGDPSGSAEKCNKLITTLDPALIQQVDSAKFLAECSKALPPSEKQISDITHFINDFIKENGSDDQVFSCRPIKIPQSTLDTYNCLSKTFSFSMIPTQNSEHNYNGMFLQSSKQLTDDTIFNRETFFNAETLEVSFGEESYLKDGAYSSNDPNALSYKVSHFISENSGTLLGIGLVGGMVGTMASLIRYKSLYKEFRDRGINPLYLPPEESKRVGKTLLQLYIASSIAVLSGVLLVQ